MQIKLEDITPAGLIWSVADALPIGRQVAERVAAVDGPIRLDLRALFVALSLRCMAALDQYGEAPPATVDASVRVPIRLVSSRAAVAGYSETIEQAAHRLGVSLRAFPVNMCSGRAPADLPARMLAAALAGEREQEAIKGLKLPNSTAQALIELLEAKRAALVEAVQAVDRARQVHAVEAPNGERLKTAQRQVASKTKAVGIAKLQLDHADEDDDLSTLQAALRERKTECAAAQSELAAATIELAAHLFEFPELRLRFPTAPLDAFLAVGGEASALRPWSGEMCAHKSPEHTNLPRWVKEWSDCCDIDNIR